jgi:hypothetical protein
MGLGVKSAQVPRCGGIDGDGEFLIDLANKGVKIRFARFALPPGM